MVKYHEGLVASDLQHHLIEALNGYHGHDIFSRQTGLVIFNKSFLRNFQVLEATDYSCHPFLRLHYLIFGGEILSINPDGEVFSKLSLRNEIELNSDNIREFLLFYFQTYTFEHEHLNIFESIDEVPYNLPPPNNTLKYLTEAFRPIAVYNTSTGFICDLSVIHSVDLLWLTVEADFNGLLRITNKQLIASDLKIRNFMFE